MLHIEKITKNKKQFIDLLLLADEQEDMIDRYLESGDLFVLYDLEGDAEGAATSETAGNTVQNTLDDLRTVCVVVTIDQNTCELKNIATYPIHQGKGYATALIKYVSDYYRNEFKYMLVGTGETPAILSFYEGYGFVKSHRIRNFFTDNYDHPMFEDSIQLVDMVYLKKNL